MIRGFDVETKALVWQRGDNSVAAAWGDRRAVQLLQVLRVHTYKQYNLPLVDKRTTMSLHSTPLGPTPSPEEGEEGEQVQHNEIYLPDSLQKRLRTLSCLPILSLVRSSE
ncbi:hypothetical protein E2C01_037909 [Portunus trituberculatus]|uniref:Uncharacterized protein n=1 Tax=Portunus trituberculatus TaxID=210409 RepID=A0A5B7FAS5_PORTR|nr:hypothetical protein [Portunus trituberculatus]